MLNKVEKNASKMTFRLICQNVFDKDCNFTRIFMKQNIFL